MATDHPVDFLGRDLKVDDYIVYPTGGTSARMVLAQITDIEGPDSKWGQSTYAHNGLQGKAKYRLTVSRLKEGSRLAQDKWGPDAGRAVKVDQLHRVVRVNREDYL